MVSRFHLHGDSTDTPLLVGREWALATLSETLELALQGNGTLALVSGEAGIGKTALVQTLVSEAKQRGTVVLTGAAYDLSATPPYGPWLELADRYPDDPQLPELPEILKRGTGVGDVQSQPELFAFVRDFFESVALARPLVLVLEDLHWADQATLDLLRYLARHVTELRILLIATYRDDEVTRTHPLFQLLPSLVRESGALRIELRPLEESDVFEFTRDQFDLDDPSLDQLVPFLLRWTEGNPLFVHELLRTLEHDGALRRTTGGWQLGELPDVAVPGLIQQMVDVRMSPLPNESRVALQMAAVIGHEVPLDLWASVSGVGVVAEASNDALESQLLTESHDRQGIAFRHALIRESIYESLSLPQRRDVHRRVADSYLARENPDPDAVAYHLQQAGDARSIEWLIYAGERAESRLAYREACERYRSAAEILQHEQRGKKTAIGLHLKIGFLLSQFDPELSTHSFRLARHLALEAGELAAAGYALVSIGANRTIAGEPERGLQEQRDGVREMADVSEDIGPETVWGIPMATTGREALQVASNGLAYALAVHGRLREAVETAERYLDIDWRKATSDRRVSEIASATINNAQAYHGLAVALSNLGQVQDGRLAYNLIEEIFRFARVNHPIVLQVAMSYLMRQHFTYRMDDLQEREELIARAEEWFETYATTIDPVSALSVHELYLLYSGRWSELRSEKQSGKLSPLTPWRTISISARARLCLHQGDFKGAAHYVDELLPEGPRTRPENHPHWLPGYQVRIAIELALETGDLAAARSWLETHDRWLEWSGALVGTAEGYVLWGRLHLAEDDVESAFDYAQRALSRASNPRQPLVLISIHRFHGELYLRSDDHDAAEHHLQQSLEHADACQTPFERAQTLLSLAELRISLGDPDGANAHLSEARRVFSELGAEPSLKRAEALSGRFTSGQSEPVFGLSKREQEVLRFIAQGKPDKEIAETLFISHHTVMRHVSSILRKLEVDSRTAAAARAVREHLV